MAPPHAAAGAAVNGAQGVDQALNPRVAALKPSKTMALTDLARTLREQGRDVIGLAAGEPDFDTPAEIIEAGIAALRSAFGEFGVRAASPNTFQQRDRRRRGRL